MGKVSPRNSNRGGNGDSQSKKSTSPIHSSPLQREVTNETPPHDQVIKTPSSSSQQTSVNEETVSASGGSAAAKAAAVHINPPQSQPLLEGGSGLGGGGMEMTSISEERETSA
jgi:hypothetical protein